MKQNGKNRILWISAILLTGVTVLTGDISQALDFSNNRIPHKQIMSGGPGKDGIPALLKPKFAPAIQGDNFLDTNDRVIGLEIDGIAKAYPISILNWHELVNDKFKDTQVVITYCPLCGTGMAFDANVDNKPLTFGVSGLLYNSDVLFYDHATESLWSQVLMMAVTGKMSGKKLKSLPVLHTTWKYWKTKHPDTLVLSPDTGYKRDYHRNPYGKYEDTNLIMFPVIFKNFDFPNKEWTLGIKIGDVEKAYPYSELRKSKKAVFDDVVAGKKLKVHFDADANTAFITDTNGKPMNGIVGFWFAWVAFYPNTEIYRAK